MLCYINPSWSRQALFRLPSTQPTQQSTRTQKRKKKRDAGNTIHFFFCVQCEKKNIFLRNRINLKWERFQRIFAERPSSTISETSPKGWGCAGHLSIKDRGPMCSLKVSKDVKGKRAKGRARERESEDVPMSALSWPTAQALLLSFACVRHPVN